MNFKPLHRNIIIERKSKSETTTSFGMVLMRPDEPDIGVVLAVSDEITEVKVGEELLVDWNHAYKFEDKYYNINIDNVIGVFD